MFTTKEITEKLGIKYDTIKNYKKEKVLTLESQKSGYYTSKDFEELKRLVVLGKAGLTCSDIKKVQTGKSTLAEVMAERRKTNEEKYERLTGSLRLSQEMLQSDIQYESLNTELYWAEISMRESEGELFMDFYEEPWKIDFIRDVKCPYCAATHKVDLEDYLFDTSSYEKECGMGPDMVYSFDSEESHVCPDCGRQFRIFGWIREYPAGAYDSEDVEISTLEKDE